MTRRLSRKSALRLMMVGGGLMAAAPAALPQGGITPGDMDRAKIPCDLYKTPTKKGGFIGPCDYKKKGTQAKIPSGPCISKSKGTQAKIPNGPCVSKNKAGVVTPSDLQNKGLIPDAPCQVKGTTGAVKK